MKQNSDNNRQHEAGTGENLRDGSPVGSQMAGRFEGLESWSREEFEAALPLYVGGELDAAEAARVDAWLVAHPEDQGTLAASKQAAGVLARYAEFTKERSTPDLWAGIRSGLIANEMLEGAPASEIPASVEVGNQLAPILGGPRWFQRKSVAAAAALLLTGSAGLSMMSRGTIAGSGEAGLQSAGSVAAAQFVAPSGTSGSPSEVLAELTPARASGVTSRSGDALLNGESGTAENPLPSFPVGWGLGSRARRAPEGRSRKLEPAQQGAERLIDDAPKAPLWQSDPWAEIRRGQVRQLGAARNGRPQLTGGR